MEPFEPLSPGATLFGKYLRQAGGPGFENTPALAARALSIFIADTALDEQQVFEALDFVQSAYCGGRDKFQPSNIVRLMKRAKQRSCISIAVKANNVHAARWLIEHKLAELNARDPDGMFPLHHAAIYARQIALMMLRAGADPAATDKAGNSALHCLAFRPWDKDYEALARELIAAGLPPNLPNKKGDTPLQTYLTCNSDEAACWMLSNHGFRACCQAPNPPLAHAALAEQFRCPRAKQLILDIARAENERDALLAAEQQNLAHFGLLAMRLIEQGLLEVQGQTLRSPDELADFAKQAPALRHGL